MVRGEINQTMKQSQDFFIYDKREVLTFCVLGGVVALFTFTLGLHLGKQISSGAQGVSQELQEVTQVQTVSDQNPGLREWTYSSEPLQPQVQTILKQRLHDEVVRSKIHLHPPRAVVLPQKTHP